jgi:pyruvate carboxylase subunit B
MRYFVTIGERTFDVDLTGPAPTIDGVSVRAELATVPGTALRHLLIDDRSVPLIARHGEKEGRWELTIQGERLSALAVDERTRAIRAMTGAVDEAAEKTVSAPMPGLVVRVQVEPGQRVAAGQGVIIVEAMKMENELKAPADGIVASIAVAAGQTVEKGALLLTFE